MKISCPHCHGNVEAAADWAGHQVDCPHCDEAFLVPLLAEVVSMSQNLEASPPPPKTNRGGKPQPFRKRFFLIGLGVVLTGVIGATLYFTPFGFGGSSPVAIKKDGKGEWDLRRLSRRSQEERDYIPHLLDMRDSVVDLREIWAEAEVLATFPYGDYWRGKSGDAAMAISRRMAASLGRCPEVMEKLVLDSNALDRAAKPLLAVRPELQDQHESVRINTELEFRINDPQVGYFLESMDLAIDDMLAALEITLPQSAQARR